MELNYVEMEIIKHSIEQSVRNYKRKVAEKKKKGEDPKLEQWYLNNYRRLLNKF